jgi:hypothetical protein
MHARFLFLCILSLTVGCGSGWRSGGGGGGDDDDSAWNPFDDDDDDAVDDDDATPISDSDGDTIADLDETGDDADGDGTGNDLDLDSDGDGIPDEEEAGDTDLSTEPIDSDGDGTPDFLDLDSDANGIPDEEEGTGDVDNDGIPDFSDVDDDNDEIPDGTEIGDPDNPVDSDGDGTPDYLDADSDNDGVPDLVEGFDDPDADGIPNYLDDDSDNDTIPDIDEVGGDPNNPPDSDSDGFYDFEDSDSDNDGIRDDAEAGYGTDPTDRDTDGDGFQDLAEIEAGSDPLNPSSIITGFYAELSPRSDTEIVVQFTPEILQADVVFVLDTTCSMTPVLQDVAQNFSSVVSNINIPNLAFGVAEFDDFAYSDLGSPFANDKPFLLDQQITDNVALVQNALSALTIKDGLDYPESAIEAVYQTASGKGFDQDCDNVYDTDTDVRPFMSVATGPNADAFSGNAGGVYNSGVPGTGTIGGAGFRPGSVPIIVYATDNELRDADNPGYFALPPACSDPAGATDASNAVNDIGGKLIGVGTNALPIAQMNTLATMTGSTADINSDGTPDNLVFEGLGPTTITSIITGIEALSNSGTFDLTLEVDEGTYSFVTGIDPAVHPQVPVGTTVSFTVGIYPGVPQAPSDQVFVFPVQVLGDGSSVLAEWELVLVVLAG